MQKEGTMSNVDRRQQLFELELDKITGDEEKAYCEFVDQGLEFQGDSKLITRPLDNAIFIGLARDWENQEDANFQEALKAVQATAQMGIIIWQEDDGKFTLSRADEHVSFSSNR